MMPSHKQCQKKLREIQRLKQKDHFTNEEIEKVEREHEYKNIIKHQYKKVFDVLPDDVQMYILGFLDTNTRLNILRSKYTHSFVYCHLSALPNTPLTIKQLYSCIKYVRSILATYLNKHGEIYQKIRYYVEHSKYHSLNLDYFLQKPPIQNKKKYIDSLISVIITAIKYYTNMYSKTKDKNEIYKNEINMTLLFCRISTM